MIDYIFDWTITMLFASLGALSLHYYISQPEKRCWLNLASGIALSGLCLKAIFISTILSG